MPALIAFPAGKLLFPVLHVIDDVGDALAHSVAQAELAVAAGADGLALCPALALGNALLVSIATAIAEAHPTLPIIINFMCPVADALRDVPSFAHLWTDKGVDSAGMHPHVASSARRADWRGTWLVGFFHKGSGRDFTIPPEALAQRAGAVAGLTDLPITSGPGTGVAPVPAELALLRAALAKAGVNRLANASGITVGNVSQFLPFVDIFLVASGIERESMDPYTVQFFKECGMEPIEVGYLDPTKTRALADAIHAHSCRVGLIGDVQYSSAEDFIQEAGTGQVAWAREPPWGYVFDWPCTRRYKSSLEILRQGIATWNEAQATCGVLLGDLLDKKCALMGDKEQCLATLKGVLGGAAPPMQLHYLFGNGDAQVLKRAGWVVEGFAHPGCTKERLYYSYCPTPGKRLLFLDTYAESVGWAAAAGGGASGGAGGGKLTFTCEPASEAARAAAEKHMEGNRFAGLAWDDPLKWRRYIEAFSEKDPGGASQPYSREELEEAFATQDYNGGISEVQRAWLEGELAAAQARGEAVFVFGHCPAHPFTCKPDGLQWKARSLRTLLQGHSCVQAYIAGHDHDGGYFFEGGVHYLVPPAPLEVSQEGEGDVAFGMLVLHGDGWELEWRGKVPPLKCGTLRGDAGWPSGIRHAYRPREPHAPAPAQGGGGGFT